MRVRELAGLLAARDGDDLVYLEPGDYAASSGRLTVEAPGAHYSERVLLMTDED